MKKNKPRQYHFMCEECLTKYSSSQEEPPPGIKWSDGHECNPVPISKEDYDAVHTLNGKSQQFSGTFNAFI